MQLELALQLEVENLAAKMCKIADGVFFILAVYLPNGIWLKAMGIKPTLRKLIAN
jgi:hypothetical protein